MHLWKSVGTTDVYLGRDICGVPRAINQHPSHSLLRGITARAADAARDATAGLCGIVASRTTKLQMEMHPLLVRLSALIGGRSILLSTLFPGILYWTDYACKMSRSRNGNEGSHFMRISSLRDLVAMFAD